jgi:hypothetical protein
MPCPASGWCVLPHAPFFPRAACVFPIVSDMPFLRISFLFSPILARMCRLCGAEQCAQRINLLASNNGCDEQSVVKRLAAAWRCLQMCHVCKQMPFTLPIKVLSCTPAITRMPATCVRHRQLSCTYVLRKMLTDTATCRCTVLTLQHNHTSTCFLEQCAIGEDVARGMTATYSFVLFVMLICMSRLCQRCHIRTCVLSDLGACSAS